jgi:hypothetical protein
MKFADYFEKAIKYGESLGLRNGTEERYADLRVELDDPKLLKLEGKEPFYPIFAGVWRNGDFIIDGPYMLHDVHDVHDVEHLKLIKMLISAYEQYLADKKEPVAADSDR